MDAWLGSLIMMVICGLGCWYSYLAGYAKGRLDATDRCTKMLRDTYAAFEQKKRCGRE